MILFLPACLRSLCRSLALFDTAAVSFAYRRGKLIYIQYTAVYILRQYGRSTAAYSTLWLYTAVMYIARAYIVHYRVCTVLHTRSGKFLEASETDNFVLHTVLRIVLFKIN